MPLTRVDLTFFDAYGNYYDHHIMYSQHKTASSILKDVQGHRVINQPAVTYIHIHVPKNLAFPKILEVQHDGKNTSPKSTISTP